MTSTPPPPPRSEAPSIPGLLALKLDEIALEQKHLRAEAAKTSKQLDNVSLALAAIVRTLDAQAQATGHDRAEATRIYAGLDKLFRQQRISIHETKTRVEWLTQTVRANAGSLGAGAASGTLVAVLVGAFFRWLGT